METHLLRFVERVRCLSGDQLISNEFALVRKKSTSIKEDYGLTTVAGGINGNVKKNRYRDILPYDQTRVCLTPTTSEYESDYINASFIKGASGDRTCIATQGPLSSTVVDFWRMIWQHNVKKKCEAYWASTTETSVFGPFTVSALEESRSNDEIIVRTLVVQHSDETRKVSHFQYTAWPDHGIPDVPDGILGMMELARQKQGDQTDPVVVHCSAGCGRTGVICAIDYVKDLLLTEQIKEHFNILDLVLELRRQRPSAVQTKEQYEFVYHTVAQMFQKFMHKQNKDTKTSDSFYINALSPKTPVKSGSLSIGVSPKPRNPALKPRLSYPPQTSMNNTYAVVNKPKLLPPTVHHYDNANADKSNNNALYSTVKPKNRPVATLSPALPTTPANDRATANQRGGTAPKVIDSDGYEVLPGELRSMNRDAQLPNHLSRSSSATESHSSTDDGYEYLTANVKETSNVFSPGSLGFNSRVTKPKGPRDPPAEWSRVER
ncbi:tyrosine-protein phosphatase non-receptor type 18 isoform X2 [Triplophysa rosa]|uniref:tyrosine-protein phosphatase non-receptor type 18 isoform X2 n=1 Tax=Triplophysa rosa TaxID=992332 RepID=UPI002545EE6F|nr:tyrosine-protein phosphatase non-receptor type 18 isoform X2 [Triplophysa rosa]